jgi:ATP-dependent Clp protease ATP-binding subunit ClpA
VFERFTDRARRVVVLAQEEARLLNHNFIGTEHLLLGLIQEHDGVAAQVLTRLGVDLAATRARVENIVGHGDSAPSGHIPFTPRAKKVLELSLRESLSLDHNHIGTEHILLGLLREGEGVGAMALVASGVDLSTVRQEVLRFLASHDPEVVPQGMEPLADTGDAVKLMLEAQRLAGEGPVRAEHLLLAIVNEQDTLTARAFAALGVTPEALTEKLIELQREEIPGEPADDDPS